MEPEITPEQARAALLKLPSVRVITGGEDDPIFLDLKSGAVARTNDSVVTIGSFFSCNLKEKTWQMSVSNAVASLCRRCERHFRIPIRWSVAGHTKGFLHIVGGRMARVEDSRDTPLGVLFPRDGSVIEEADTSSPRRTVSLRNSYHRRRNGRASESHASSNDPSLG